jgi:hypothetical protein
MNHYKANTDDLLRFPAIKKSAHGSNSVVVVENIAFLK